MLNIFQTTNPVAYTTFHRYLSAQKYAHFVMSRKRNKAVKNKKNILTRQHFFAFSDV